MKKVITVLLGIILSLALVACGGEKYMSDAEFLSYVEFIELTTENCMEYLEIFENEELDNFGEPTGEKILRIKLKDGYNAISFDSEDEYANEINLRVSYDWTAKWSYDDIEYEMQTSETDVTLYNCEMDAYLVNTYLETDTDTYERKVSNIQITKIKGTIFKAEIPQERWSTTEEGLEYLRVGTKDEHTIIRNNDLVIYGLQNAILDVTERQGK